MSLFFYWIACVVVVPDRPLFNQNAYESQILCLCRPFFLCSVQNRSKRSSSTHIQSTIVRWSTCFVCAMQFWSTIGPCYLQICSEYTNKKNIVWLWVFFVFLAIIEPNQNCVLLQKISKRTFSLLRTLSGWNIVSAGLFYALVKIRIVSTWTKKNE